MKRRWFIRICFMLPILICLIGWVWSGMYLTFIGYGHGERQVHLGTDRGAFWVGWVVGSTVQGWRSDNLPVNPPEFWPSKSAFDSAWFLGFSHRYFGLIPGRSAHFFHAPYWFLIVVCGGVFAWVWRKTRPKPDPKTAFPVEVGSQHV